MKFQASLSRCGTNLRQLREKRRMTVDALAVLSGVAADTIRSFEQGQGGDVTIADLLKIAGILNVGLIPILGRTGPGQVEID